MRSIIRIVAVLLLLLEISATSAHAIFDDFRREIKERLDPGKSYGLYQKALEMEAPFETVCNQIESNIHQSDWEIITSWDLDTPDVCDARARVYLIQNDDYTHAVLSKGARHLIFLPIRIGVFQKAGKVVVVFTNPELLAKVFFADLPFVQQDEMVAMSNVVKKDLVTLCVKGMEGTILTEQLPPIRNDRDIRFFWSGIRDQFDVVRRIPLQGSTAEALKKVAARLEKGVRIQQNGWRVIFSTMIEDQACLIGVSNKHIEDLTLNYIGLKWPSFLDRDPCSGLYHLTEFPIEILVFVEEGEIRVGILDQFWRMRFYLWDDPYRTGITFLARDPNYSSRIYKALLGIIRFR
jgi:hypothetical protein